MAETSSTYQARLILASQSPRRRYLLSQAGLTFEVIPSLVDEEGFAMDDPAAGVRRLAEAKAGEVARNFPESWIIGADTVVQIGAEILGKPRSKAEARAMLAQLSGQTHKVLTGYAIRRHAKDYLFSETIVTDVTFKHLTATEIEWYIQTREPFDKAGAYAVQGLGTFLVRRINGSYTNVVGLPVSEVISHLIAIGAVELLDLRPNGT